MRPSAVKRLRERNNEQQLEIIALRAQLAASDRDADRAWKRVDHLLARVNKLVAAERMAA